MLPLYLFCNTYIDQELNFLLHFCALFRIMKGKTVEPNDDCELEKFRERLINENEALNKLLRNLQNPGFRAKEFETTPIVQVKDNISKSK